MPTHRSCVELFRFVSCGRVSCRINADSEATGCAFYAPGLRWQQHPGWSGALTRVSGLVAFGPSTVWNSISILWLSYQGRVLWIFAGRQHDNSIVLRFKLSKASAMSKIFISYRQDDPLLLSRRSGDCKWSATDLTSRVPLRCSSSNCLISSVNMKW
jgi:hypothetical protein